MIKSRDLLRAATVVVMLAGIWNVTPSHAANGSQNYNPWGKSYFPNVPLTTMDGKPVKFYDDLIKGKVVAVNFIFTGCTASCGMETARMRQVQQLLGDRVGKDVFFYSITIDPDNDSPEALKAYAKKFDVGPGWTFLTGDIKDIDMLRSKFGLYKPPQLVDGQIDHDLSMMIGNDTTGRWQKASPMENPEVLATQIGSWLSNWKGTPTHQNPSYAKAPVRLPQLSKGEELFRTRCATCHTVGINDTPMAKTIGPDLTYVTSSRDRNWLVRWIREPDVMLAEKDPLAMTLYAKYNKLAMPNLKLKDGEIESLLSFMEKGAAAMAAKK
ncbi:SCO family protein [Ramlibacter sp.]|uniref:SCO family protein n=1 Tax=Ramlibacter sp. TaxID=1917967 RepID=UPI0026157CB3|nr:SCO family protein [Ramlibacter sp.]MDB5954658.1 electron transport protein SCO1/SenC [Ramlibacter sp.]